MSALYKARKGRVTCSEFLQVNEIRGPLDRDSEQWGVWKIQHGQNLEPHYPPPSIFTLYHAEQTKRKWQSLTEKWLAHLCGRNDGGRSEAEDTLGGPGQVKGTPKPSVSLVYSSSHFQDRKRKGISIWKNSAIEMKE